MCGCLRSRFLHTFAFTATCRLLRALLGLTGLHTAVLLRFTALDLYGSVPTHVLPRYRFGGWFVTHVPALVLLFTHVCYLPTCTFYGLPGSFAVYGYGWMPVTPHHTLVLFTGYAVTDTYYYLCLHVWFTLPLRILPVCVAVTPHGYHTLVHGWLPHTVYGCAVITVGLRLRTLHTTARLPRPFTRSHVTPVTTVSLGYATLHLRYGYRVAVHHTAWLRLPVTHGYYGCYLLRGVRSRYLHARTFAHAHTRLRLVLRLRLRCVCYATACYVRILLVTFGYLHARLRGSTHAPHHGFTLPVTTVPVLQFATLPFVTHRWITYGYLGSSTLRLLHRSLRFGSGYICVTRCGLRFVLVPRLRIRGYLPRYRTVTRFVTIYCGYHARHTVHMPLRLHHVLLRLHFRSYRATHRVLRLPPAGSCRFIYLHTRPTYHRLPHTATVAILLLRCITYRLPCTVRVTGLRAYTGYRILPRFCVLPGSVGYLHTAVRITWLVYWFTLVRTLHFGYVRSAVAVCRTFTGCWLPRSGWLPCTVRLRTHTTPHCHTALRFCRTVLPPLHTATRTTGCLRSWLYTRTTLRLRTATLWFTTVYTHIYPAFGSARCGCGSLFCLPRLVGLRICAFGYTVYMPYGYSSRSYLRLRSAVATVYAHTPLLLPFALVAYGYGLYSFDATLPVLYLRTGYPVGYGLRCCGYGYTTFPWFFTIRLVAHILFGCMRYAATVYALLLLHFACWLPVPGYITGYGCITHTPTCRWLRCPRVRVLALRTCVYRTFTVYAVLQFRLPHCLLPPCVHAFYCSVATHFICCVLYAVYILFTLLHFTWLLDLRSGLHIYGLVRTFADTRFTGSCSLRLHLVLLPLVWFPLRLRCGYLLRFPIRLRYVGYYALRLPHVYVPLPAG